MNTPPQNHLVDLVRRYSAKGILLDSNILLVYVVGEYDSARIRTFKRTNAFTEKDHAFLVEFLANFQRVIATPHILTEVSNLAGNLGEPHRSECFATFANRIALLTEQTETAQAISATRAFRRLGITDASLPLIARDRFLVLTDDLLLHDHLLRSGIDAINFNHIRLLGWRR